MCLLVVETWERYTSGLRRVLFRVDVVLRWLNRGERLLVEDFYACSFVVVVEEYCTDP